MSGQVIDTRIVHGWWASDRPLAYLMCGFPEPMSPRPALWLRMFEPGFIAEHGTEQDEFNKYTDLPLGILMHREAFVAFVRFMDALCAQIESTKVPQPTPLRRENDDTETETGP